MIRLTVVALALVVATGCSAIVGPSPETPGNLDLPGPFEELPSDADVAHASGWADASRRLPAGIDLDGRWMSEFDAMQALSMRFGDRPMPPGAPGISSEQLPGSARGVERLLVTVPTFVGAEQWGEQYVLVIGQERDGWRLRQAFGRSLCTSVSENGPCADPLPAGDDG